MKKKYLILSILSIVILSSVAFASSYSKNITAYYHNIKVMLNGKTVAMSHEPFIYNGTTYVPLRDISENLGANVYWDNATKTINMYNQSSSNILDNSATINSLKDEIKKKDKKIEDLEDELDDDRDNDNDDEDDLEDRLDDDYDIYKKGYTNLKFDFDVNAKSSETIIKMYGDFDRTSKDWKDRDTYEFRDYIEGICKESVYYIKEDVNIIVYDEDDSRCAEYTYDRSDKDLKKDYEY